MKVPKVYNEIDGALLVDKPAGPTSHDIVAIIRRNFRIKKVGHCGTLDPNATGLLIIVLGKATKLSEKLMSDDKTYTGQIKFGAATDSYDVEGNTVSEAPVPADLTLDKLNDYGRVFVGDQLQTPPMVSAVKIDGVPLYKLARKGVEVERKPRLIHIYSFRFLNYKAPVGEFRIACTKGTYVRSIANDIGRDVGSGAFLNTLRRTQSGKYSVDDAVTMDQIRDFSLSDLRERVIPMLKISSE